MVVAYLHETVQVLAYLAKEQEGIQEADGKGATEEEGEEEEEPAAAK